MNKWLRDFLCSIGLHDPADHWAMLPCSMEFNGLPDLLAAALRVKQIQVHYPRFGVITLVYSKCRRCGHMPPSPNTTTLSSGGMP